MVPSVFVQPENDEAFKDAAGRSARLALYGRCLHEMQGGQIFPVFFVQLYVQVQDFQSWFPDAHTEQCKSPSIPIALCSSFMHNGQNVHFGSNSHENTVRP